MRKMRSIIALGVVLVLLLGSYVYLKNRPPKQVEPGPITPSIDISRFDRETIKKITLKNEKGELAFEKKEDVWIITKPYKVEILQNTVNDLARTFSALGAEVVVEEEPGDLAPYGLKDPVGTGEAVLADGSKVVLYLGNRTADGNTYYLMKEGDPKLYTVWMHHGQRLNSGLSEYRDKNLVQINFQELRYFFMSRPKLEDIEIIINDELDEEQAQFGLGIYQMTKPYNKPMGVDSRIMGEIIEAFPKLVLRDFINDHPDNLALYGLEEPSGRLTIKDRENTLDLILGSDTEDGKQIHFQIAGSDAVYTMDKALLGFMDTKPFSLVEKFAFIVNIDHVDRVLVEGFDRRHTITLPRKTEKAEVEGKEDEIVTTYFVDGKEMEEKPFKRYYQSLIGLLVDAENYNEPDVKPDVRTTFYVNKGPDREIVIEYLPYDRDFYSVVRGGRAEFLISRHRLVRMFEEMDLLLQGE